MVSPLFTKHNLDQVMPHPRDFLWLPGLNAPAVHSGLYPTSLSNLSLLLTLHVAFASSRWTSYHSVDPAMLSFHPHTFALALYLLWYLSCTISRYQNPTHSRPIKLLTSYISLLPLWDALFLVSLSIQIISRSSLQEVVSSLKAGSEHSLTHLCVIAAPNTGPCT